MPKLRNTSSRPTKEIRDLTKWVAQWYLSANTVELEVGGHTNWGDMAHGVASPERVEILLPATDHYPVSTKLCRSTERVTLHNWKEEYVFVLAHELRHVDQFYAGDVKNYEKDAENFATMVLREYRNQRSSP